VFGAIERTGEPLPHAKLTVGSVRVSLRPVRLSVSK